MAKGKGKKLELKRTRNEEQEELLLWVRRYLGWQKLRIMSSNTVAALERRGVILADEAQAMRETWVDVERKEEKDAAAVIVEMVRKHPTWLQWMKDVRGIGELIAGQVIAYAQPIADFKTPSSLKAYAGYAVYDGEAQGFKRGGQPNWSQSFKRVLYNVGDSFIKSRSPYRAFYDQCKARELETHPEMGTKGGQWSPAHRDLRARRKMVSVFLHHLWQVMHDIEGLPTREPYAMQYLDHTTYVSPWEMVQQPDECDQRTACDGEVAVA